MPSITLNYFTKEIELKGTESFIESNFKKIQDPLVESLGVKRRIRSRATKAKIDQDPISFVKREKSQTSAEIDKPELFEAPSILPATEPVIPQISHDLKEQRPPLRKYIRYVGPPGRQKISIQVVEQKSSIISLTSLKEKFGLPEAKIEGIIRDAEKLGKIRRTANGSLVWAED